MPESNDASVDFDFQSGDFKPNQPAPEPAQPAPDQTPPTPAPRVADPSPSGSWLDSLLGGVDADVIDPDPEDPDPEDPDPDEVGDDGFTDEEREYVKKNGKGALAEFYRQKYSQQPTDEPANNEPELSPEETRLKGIDDGIKAAKDKVAELTKRHRHALLNGADDQELDRIESELEDQRMEIVRMTNRREGVANQVEQRQITSLQQQYENGFVERMVTDHGLSKEQADKIRGRIIQDPRISAMLAQANTRELLAMPLVQDVFTKAALYDMQYNTKKRTRAPGDPAPRGGRSGGGVGSGDGRAKGGFPESDKGFTQFMQGDNKGGKK